METDFESQKLQIPLQYVVGSVNELMLLMKMMLSMEVNELRREKRPMMSKKRG